LHSPEFDTERSLENVGREVHKLEITYPIVLDNDLKMWDALGNRYWPTIYLVDRKGRIRHVQVGETHLGTAEALEFERLLVDLLKEPG